MTLGSGLNDVDTCVPECVTIPSNRSGVASKSTSTGMCPRGVTFPRSWKIERRFPPFVAMGSSARSSSPVRRPVPAELCRTVLVGRVAHRPLTS